MQPEPVTTNPLNAHTPAAALRHARTPASAFYVRSHFAAPKLDAATWRLRLPDRALSLADLRAMPQRALDVVLECAGNGRTRMSPVPPGTPWGERAVACGRFGGVPLRDLISPGDATELVFEGADEGEKNGTRMRYARSLPMAEAMRPDVLVALDLDGEPLALDHGAPARLLVPGWYGMASVKWLVEVRATREPFRGHFQANDYRIRRSRDREPDAPLSTMRVKSLVVAPGEGERLRAGEPAEVWGWAWSGAGPIHAVEVSRDGGRAWHAATLEKPASPHAWTRWSLAWTPQARGRVTLLARATDAAGHAQPAETPWNEQGYGNNECGHATVEIL